jgi:hypothetical protein
MKLQDRNDLKMLVDQNVEESINLEYKASDALARTNEAINELCKDVSAMANSTGGQIIYGIQEDKKRKFLRLDDGVSDAKITREWIEQILNSRVQPRMANIQTTRIDMQNGRFGYVISVPQTLIGPHQAPDRKYYRRFDLQSVPMYDYEIRDVMRRSTTPDLYLTLRLRVGPTQVLRFTVGDQKSDPVPLVFCIGNRSSQPATHVIVTIALDPRLTISSPGDFDGPLRQTEGDSFNRYRLLIRPPNWLPIFKEAKEDELSIQEFHVRISAAPSIPKDFLITGLIQSPGFTREQRWKLIDSDKQVEVVETD